MVPNIIGCEECRIKGLSKKSLKSYNYDYGKMLCIQTSVHAINKIPCSYMVLMTCSFAVAKVRVLTQVVRPEAQYYSVSVKEYFHPSSKTVSPISIIHTQSSNACPCVNLKINKEYLIAGFFKDGGILFLPSDGALIERWGNVVYSDVKELVLKVYSN